MPELKNSKNQMVEVPEIKDFQYGLGYIMAKLAQMARELSQPVNIKDQTAVDAGDLKTKKFARLQKLRDSKN